MTGTGAHLRRGAFVGETGIIVGRLGASPLSTILRTVDGGRNWTGLSLGLPAGTTALVNDVAGWDADRCVAVGVAGTAAVPAGSFGAIFTTSDGGASWTRQIVAATGFSDVALHGANLARAVGGGAAILRSTDGGTTWSKPTSNPATEALSTVHFRDADHGVVAGNGRTLMTTTDGGQTWSPVGQPGNANAYAVTVRFVTDQLGWLVASNTWT